MIKQEQIIGDIPPSKEVYRKTFDVAWPSAVESVLVNLINSIDTIMVGSIGASAIAAVGITNQPKFILLALIFSLNIGVTTVIARRRGEQNQQGANRCLRQAIMVCMGLSLLLSCIGFFGARPILSFAGAGQDILDEAVAYFRINMLGFVFMSVGLTINAAQRGAGNTKISMRTNLVANSINLILNYLLIGGNLGFPKMGVQGAALATIIGQLIAFIMSVLSIVKRNSFLVINREDKWNFDQETMSSVLKIASSAVVEQVFMRAGFFIYAKIVAGLGTAAFATHQICMNIIGLSFAFGDGFSTAVTSLVGQSLGANRSDMAQIYVKATKKIMYAISSLLFCIFIFGRAWLVGLFTDDMQIIQQGSQIMYVIAITTVAQTSALVYSGCLRGAGDAKFNAFVAFISIAILRPFNAWLFCYPIGLGLFGAWISLLIDQCIRWICNYLRFRGGYWKQIKV